ncbi:unnamed protein product [Cylicocyclus nassatus]|uniref:Protein kinase domain-containing protein n=1 Tax=Cylicocyclus nassatus TaxID=53992 RepID=A0AA36M7J0_CYLNA|nr:unnamed protein product [Cylicocyclus nassatus]
MSDSGPVQLPKGKVVGRKWKIVKKLGEGGCGAVYKVQDITNKTSFAALKAESNFVAGGTVLKLEVQILKRLAGRPHVPQLIHSGKKELYCYMVMTLLGDSLGALQKKFGRISSVSTQVRVGINILFGVKQLHDIGFVHRDLKPANVALGRPNTPEYRFLHILDFGLAREFVVIGDDHRLQMRRPRPRALFRGTTRYCSINTHEKGEQGRVDDLWSVLYMLAEMRGSLPWSNLREKKDINEMKKKTLHETLLKNSPYQLVQFARHLDTLNYYSHPDYSLLHRHFMEIMKAGKFKFTDPYDWEKKLPEKAKNPPTITIPPETLKNFSVASASLDVPVPATGIAGSKQKLSLIKATEEDPFPADWFRTNPLGF